MAINNNDVKLFESQRLSDEEDGGGRVTGREVIDGNVNNPGYFPDRPHRWRRGTTQGVYRNQHRQ